MNAPPPLDQKKEIKRLVSEADAFIKTGDEYCLISFKWFLNWKAYVDYADTGEDCGAEPDAIDNSNLLSSKNKVKEGIMQTVDYDLVPLSAWKILQKWYGGGPQITRKMIEVGDNFMCEVHLWKLPVIRLSHTATKIEEKLEIQVSRQLSIGKLRKWILCTKFNVPPHKARLWKLSKGNDGKKTYTKLKDEEVIENVLSVLDKVVVEVQQMDGSWLVNPDSIKKKGKGISKMSSGGMQPSHSTTTSTSSFNSSYNNNYGPTRIAGVCGLCNLGNTCFMNSALQCLSNTELLTKYFLANEHKAEINTHNPLGTKGVLATEYAKLIQNLWSGRYGSVAPADFKRKLGKFAPQFSGYRQHDSQELLAFLLDGLHEDLNRILDKPYVENKDNDEIEDSEAAQIAWDAHLLRNKSVIVDLFQGQLKSTVVCPDCPKVSVTFDPFMYLSLPLPHTNDRQLKIMVVRADGSPPTKYKWMFPKQGGKVELIRQKVQETLKIPLSRMYVCEVYFNKIYNPLPEHLLLSRIKDSDDIFVYEWCNPSVILGTTAAQTADSGDPDDEKVQLLQCVQRMKTQTSYHSRLTGYPRLLGVTDNTTVQELYALAYRAFCGNLKEKPGDDMDSLPADELAKIGGELFKLTPCNTMATAMGKPFESDCTELLSKHLPKVSKLLITLDWNISSDLLHSDASMITQDKALSESSKPSGGLDLYECLKLFVKQETLGEDDKWYCPKCKDFKQADKKFDIWKLPNVLVIHLKRFQYNRYWRDKITTRIEFPTDDLDMKDYVVNTKEENTTYQLFAVSNHSGGLGGGHYTAFAQNYTNKKWYSFNDSSTSSVSSLSTLQSGSAYLLFYKRISPE